MMRPLPALSGCIVALTAAVLTTGCASLPARQPVVARSRLGNITSHQFHPFLLERGALTVAQKRARLEEMLAVRAAESEALRLGLLETEAGRARLKEREEEILVAEMRVRLERRRREAAGRGPRRQPTSQAFGFATNSHMKWATFAMLVLSGAKTLLTRPSPIPHSPTPDPQANLNLAAGLG